MRRTLFRSASFYSRPAHVAIWLLTAIALAQPAAASPAAYTLTGVMTGTLGTQPFNNAMVTWTVYGDTASVGQPNHPMQYQNVGTFGSINISGIASAAFTVPLTVQADQRSGKGDIAIGGSATAEIQISDPSNVDAWASPLTTAFGPLTDPGAVSFSAPLATTQGGLTITVVGNVTFQALLLPPQILSQFVFGGGWYSALYFTNNGTGAVSISVTFIADSGMPLVVPSIGASTTTINLAAQTTAILEAPDVGALSEGYVTASFPGGVSGYGVFRQSVPGVPDQEAVVPFAGSVSTSSTLVWDDTAYTSAVAISNPSAVPVTVAITVWNTLGAVIGTASIPLAAGAKTEAALRGIQGLAAVAGQRGSAQFTVTTGSVAVLGLRFNGTAFTSIPTSQQ